MSEKWIIRTYAVDSGILKILECVSVFGCVFLRTCQELSRMHQSASCAHPETGFERALRSFSEWNRQPHPVITAFYSLPCYLVCRSIAHSSVISMGFDPPSVNRQNFKSKSSCKFSVIKTKSRKRKWSETTLPPVRGGGEFYSEKQKSSSQAKPYFALLCEY